MHTYSTKHSILDKQLVRYLINLLLHLGISNTQQVLSGAESTKAKSYCPHFQARTQANVTQAHLSLK